MHLQNTHTLTHKHTRTKECTCEHIHRWIHIQASDTSSDVCLVHRYRDIEIDIDVGSWQVCRVCRYRYIDIGKDGEIWMYCLHYVSMQSSIYLCRCKNRYIHTYPYKYMCCTTHKCIYLFLRLLRLSLSLLRSFSLSPALLLFSFLALSLCRLSLSHALALLLSCSIALSFSLCFSLAFALAFHVHTNTLCSLTSCLFYRLPLHSLSLTLCLNQLVSLMIPKQGESTCDSERERNSV